jgi:hypothetical protein
MRVPPQVSDRIKEAPAQALRGVFAGIGQVLLITDKLRNKTPAPASYARAPQPADPRPVPPTPPVSPAPPVPPAPVASSVRTAAVADQAPEVRDFDKTGNVRLLTSGKAEADAPLPNYDELSVASLRARLRNLDVAQVRQLAAYEQTHAARADVMTMFERRIAKLEATPNADEQGEADAEAEVEAREEVAADTEAEVAAEGEDEA